jgi:hypothetical protein
LGGLIAVDIQKMNDDTPRAPHSGVAFGHSAQGTKRLKEKSIVDRTIDLSFIAGEFFCGAGGSGHAFPRHGQGQKEGKDGFYGPVLNKPLIQKHMETECNTLTKNQKFVF